MTEPFTTKLFCPQCGQKLTVPTADLRVTYRCPRCGAAAQAGDLIPVDRTIAAVPAPDLGACAAPGAAILAARHTGAADDLLPPITEPMPGAPPRAPFAHVGIRVDGALPPRALAPTESHDGPGLVTLAVGGVRAGAGAMGRAGSLLLRCTGTADRFLGQRRARVGLLFTVSAFVLVAPHFDKPWSPTYSMLSVVSFLGLIGLFGLARVAAFRDESGWHAALVGRTLGEGAESVAAWAQRLMGAPRPQKLGDIGKVVLFAGLLSAASANVVDLLGAGYEVVGTLRDVGVWGLGLGCVVLVLGRLDLRRRAKKTGCVLNSASVEAAQHAVNKLPLVLDCSDESALDSATAKAGHPLVAALLRELAKPWPRPYYNDEREYQSRLLKRLQMSMPEANPRAEKWIGERERADLLLGDVNSGVLIEMKVRAENAATLQRLVGQADQYLRVWKGRGPMLLVLCKTSAEVKGRLEGPLASMRRDGHAVMAVLAAP